MPEEALPPYSESLTVDSDPACLYEIRQFVERMAARAGIDPERCFDLKVAVSEACANAVEHAGTRSDPLVIYSETQPDRLIFQVCDAGDFHLSGSSLSRRKESQGLGLPLMVALMDEVRFAKRPEGGTSVTLSLLVNPENEGEGS